MKPPRIGTRLLALAIAIAGGYARAQESAQPIIVDNAPARLTNVRPRFMSTTFSPDGKLLVTTAGSPTLTYDEPGELIVWDLPKLTKRLIIRQEKTIRSAAFSPDGTLLATGDFGGNVLILDPATGKTLVELPERAQPVNMVRFTPDGKFLLACGFDGKVVIWNVAEKSVADTLSAPDQRLVTISVTPNGKYLAACSQEGHSFVWDLANRKPLYYVLSSPLDPNTPRDTETIAFSPDGKTFATGSYDNTVMLWNTEDGHSIRKFDGHTTQVCKLAFSPDGDRLFTSDYEGNIMNWNPATGQRSAHQIRHNGPCYAMAVSPDGKVLATAGFDKKVKLLDANTLQTQAMKQEDNPLTEAK
jgi:WD40 repeat protein